MEVWEHPETQSDILDYLHEHQLLASFTSMGGVAVREGAHCHCVEPQAVGEQTLLRCLVDFEEELGFGAAGAQRLRQQGELHVALDQGGQVADAWLCRPDFC